MLLHQDGPLQPGCGHGPPQRFRVGAQEVGARTIEGYPVHEARVEDSSGRHTGTLSRFQKAISAWRRVAKEAKGTADARPASPRGDRWG